MVSVLFKMCFYYTCMWLQVFKDDLEVELQVVVSLPMWVLGTELGSSGRAGNTLKHEAISPAVLVSVLSHQQESILILYMRQFLLVVMEMNLQ